MIANITATLDGKQVEANNDVSRTDLCSLLSSTFEDDNVDIVVHEYLDEELIEDVKSRYPHRWDARVQEAL